MTEDTYVTAIREYIDFLNQQVGMYTDACAGFSKNKVLIQRQVARILRASGMRTDESGHPVVMHTSLEDPSRPDVIHHRTIRAGDYIAENSEEGSHEQQHARAIIIFIFTYWEDEIRPRLATAKGVDKDAIKLDIMGDLRILRHSILHAKGILRLDKHKSLKLLGSTFDPDKLLVISNERMHKIFVLAKQGAARLMLDHIGPTRNSPNPDKILSIAIQTIRR
jgi:hypothetical protein